MELTFELSTPDEAVALFGLGDRNLKLLRETFPVRLTARGRVLRLAGEPDDVEKVGGLLRDMISKIEGGLQLPPTHLEETLRRMHADGTSEVELDEARAGGEPAPLSAPAGGPRAPGGGRSGSEGGSRLSEAEIKSLDEIARSKGQREYLRAIAEQDVVFCVGPAGTGKTFLAVRMAVSLLRDGQVKKLILCRPAVEAGEKLGFLPGDFYAKINPYLRPLYDALNEILDYDRVKRYLEREIIEIIPLAYMRGRTLNNAFIILDEGQNTTVAQMKMFLTRLGMYSRIVVNGDPTQVDLPDGQLSGLIHAGRVIRGVRDIAWCELGGADIVRHPLVKRIVEAYENVSPSRRT